MNFRNIIKGIEKTDAEVCNRLSDRRDALKNFGSAVAEVTLPFASLLKKPYGKTNGSVVDALNAALELEYFEYAFYRTANSTPGLIPMADAAGFKSIEAHEQGHVQFFEKAIAQLGGVTQRPDASAFNFTKGGAYPVFSDYNTFLMTAQAIEDAGLRAHTILLEALAGHSLFAKVQQLATAEARHAAHSRMIRREMHVENVPARFLTNNFATANIGQKSNHTGRTKHSNLGLV